jgi:hypothetical protein
MKLRTAYKALVLLLLLAPVKLKAQIATTNPLEYAALMKAMNLSIPR